MTVTLRANDFLAGQNRRDGVSVRVTKALMAHSCASGRRASNFVSNGGCELTCEVFEGEACCCT
jgi:hypothetical protein